MTEPQATGAMDGRQATETRVARVRGMRLRGAVTLFIIEGAAVEESPGAERGVARKLGILARQNEARVVACGMRPGQRTVLEREVPPDQLEVVDADLPLDVTAVIQRAGSAPDACLAILSAPGARIPDGCHAFHVGPGDPPANAIASQRPGVAAANEILALYGTALAQERAGYAFRATSAGNLIPDAADIASGVWSGVRRSVERPDPPQPVAPTARLNDDEMRALASRAYQRLRANLQPNGAVIGSPARGQQPGEPNYWFFWQRDGAAAMSWLTQLRHATGFGVEPGALDQPIAHYLDILAAIQKNGPLGTSRYQVSGEPVLGFGNPQLDGPALTVLALARLDDPARAWPLAKVYLDFLLTPDGQGRTMDTWEFLYGRTFNATLLRRKALLAGAGMAERLGHTSDAARFRDGAQNALDELSDFVDHTTGRLVASRDTLDPWFGATSGLDMAIVSALLAPVPIITTDTTEANLAPDRPRADLDQFAHPAVLATMMALEDAFASRYRVNRDWRAGGNPAGGIGRFPEDANDGLGSTGGNPWPLATLWAAQFCYRVAWDWRTVALNTPEGVTLHDPCQAAFINRAAGEDLVEVGRLIPRDTWLRRVDVALLMRSRQYLDFVTHHLPSDGGVTEQIDRDTGQPRGAPDLSWALAELIRTISMVPGIWTQPTEQAARGTG